MYPTITSGLVAILVLGSTSLLRAESGTDAMLDTSRTGFAYQQVLTTKPVALPKASAKSDSWMDHASQVVDGGGF